ncbi:ribonuclease H-like domain-containing protein [Candidatus Woesearchaeota archaeon]|nr:ribonuclease H-like domain-containing protein [Candidatus Woesearchaeota archaeon]
MSIEVRVSNLFRGFNRLDRVSACIDLLPVDLELRDLIIPFTRKRKLDLNSVHPDFRKRAERFSESGIIDFRKLPKYIKDILKLRCEYIGVNGKIGTKQLMNDLGFYNSSDIYSKENLIAILEGYGYVREKNANNNSKCEKVFSKKIKNKDYPLFKAICGVGRAFKGSANFAAGIRELGFSPSFNFYSEEMIKSILTSVWPYHKVKEAYEKNDPSILIPWSEFTKDNPNVFFAIKNAAFAKKIKQKRKKKIKKRIKLKRKSHLQEMPARTRINRLYEEFPDLFNFISTPTIGVNKKVLSNLLQELNKKGVNISHSYLANSREPGLRKVFNQLRYLTKRNSATVSEEITKLIGPARTELVVSSESRNLLGNITEYAAKIVLLMTYLVDNTGDFFNNGFARYFSGVDDIQPKIGRKVRISYNNHHIEPDLMVSSGLESCLVEVRAGWNVKNALDLIKKFSYGREFKEINSSKTKIIAVLQMPEQIVDEAAPFLEESGILVISGKTFFDYFSKAVRKLERSPYHTLVANAVPNKRHSLVNLINYQKRIIEEPHVMLKSCNACLLKHHHKVLSALVSCLENAIANPDNLDYKERKYRPIESVLDDNSSQAMVGSFYCQKYLNGSTPFSDMDIPTARYVRKNIQNWQNGKIRNRMNYNFFIPIDDILVVDIENTGFHNDSPIFLNGLGYFDKKRNDFVFRGLFARDLYEEEAILKVFDELRKDKKYIISFNGSSFDLPRLQRRCESYIIPFDFCKDKHLDIMHAVFPFVKKNNLEDRKLTTLEFATCGFVRPDDDVAGKDIPYRYWDYCRGGNPEPLGRIFRHNKWDIVSTIAQYVFLLKNPEYFNENCFKTFKL